MVRTAGVVLILALVAISPWPFGCEPIGQFAVALTLLALVSLWTAYGILSGRFRYRSDAVAACLLGLATSPLFNSFRYPRGFVRFLSPTAVEWNLVVPINAQLANR